VVWRQPPPPSPRVVATQLACRVSHALSPVRRGRLLAADVVAMYPPPPPPPPPPATAAPAPRAWTSTTRRCATPCAPPLRRARLPMTPRWGGGGCRRRRRAAAACPPAHLRAARHPLIRSALGTSPARPPAGAQAAERAPDPRLELHHPVPGQGQLRPHAGGRGPGGGRLPGQGVCGRRGLYVWVGQRWPSSSTAGSGGLAATCSPTALPLQEYVELETCYIDTLERQAAQGPAGPAALGDFGAQ
jgi:hypothetical protein